MQPTVTPPRTQGRAALPALLALLTAVLLAASASAQSVFINEIHYDNTGGDVGEFVEIAGPAGTDLTDWDVVLYNGSNGTRYGTIGLSGTIDDEGNGFGVLSFDMEGVQNGAPDGLALVDAGGNVVQFLSYEGSFTASGGPADGQTSTDIGVDEDPAPPAGQSLQLKGSGTTYGDFAWSAPSPDSPGRVNDGQTFEGDGGGTPGMIVVNTADDEDNADGDCSLREAVRAANTNAAVDGCAAGDADGDTITFAAPYTITLSMGELLVTDDVDVDASGVGGVTVDAGGDSRIFDVDAAGGAGSEQEVAFTSLTLQNGNSSMGGSSAPDAGGAVDLKAGSEATFTDVNVFGSTAGLNGGGIHAGGGTVVLVTTSADGASEISGNTALVEGGGLWTSGTLTVSGNTLVDDNEGQGDAADGGGGGLYNQGGTLTVGDGVTVSNNRATGASGSGGGILNNGGTLTVGAATITGNTSNRAGGGIEDAAGTVTLTGATVTNNNAGASPGNGGGLHSGGGTVTVVGGEVSDNTAVEGGGLWASGTLRVSGGTLIDGNVALSDADPAFEGGGGLFNQAGTMTVDGATVSNNTALGAGGSGGGAFNQGAGTLTVTNSTFAGNSALRAGGGIEANGGLVALTDVDFDQNTTGGAPGNGGALHATAGDVTVSGGSVTDNVAAQEGGGFWINAGFTMTVDGTSFSGNDGQGNDADDGGGALFNNGGTLVVTDADILSNTASGAAGSGGGILNNGGTLTVTGGLIQFNQANRAGAGIEDAGGTVTLTGVTVNANAIADASPGNGGGLHSGGGTVTIVGGAYTRNSAVEGGGLWTNSTLDIRPAADGTPTLIALNTATGDDAAQGGGGLYAESGATVTSTSATIGWNAATGASGSGGGVLVADDASVSLSLGVVTWNSANRAGGGIEVADDATTDAPTTLTLDRVGVTENSIDVPAPGNGGGLHVGGAGSVTATQTTFANNGTTASMDEMGGPVNQDNEGARAGGGLWISAAGVLDLSLSTVSNNNAFGNGGGVYDDGPGGSIALSSVTVAENTAIDGGRGGGLYSESTDGASFTFENTIVADNVAVAGGDDCFGTFTSGGFNLVEDTSGCTINGATDSNVTGQDARLGPLADNGGPTKTRALQTGSPAIDAGRTAFVIDQRGFGRADGADDIGAFEFGAQDDGLIACAVGSPLSFDFDGDGNGRGSNVMADDFNSTGTDATFGEFVGVRNEGDDAPVALSTCTFVVFDPFDEDITYTLGTTGTVGPDQAYVLATMNGNQDFGQADVLTDSPGAFALVEGGATVGADFRTVLGRIVAAVVYDRDRSVFGSMGGRATDADRAAFAAALAQVTSGATPTEETPSALAVTVAPNPIANVGRVTWALPSAADVRVTLYDALGRQVAVLADGAYGTGRHTVDLPVSALPAGVYVVRAVLGTEARTTRVTVVR